MKNQKGITLIALVITIIIMLILVGVSITVALNGGLFTTAKNAADETELEKDKEMTLSSGRIKVGGKWYDSLEDYKAGKESANQSGEIIENKAYLIGDEVTVGGEPFYIIAVDNENDKLTLLAKYNLNSSGTAQDDTEMGSYFCTFSNINYWYNSETDTYKTDLNAVEVPEKVGTETVTSVITTARNYGNAKGGKGRLLTLDEANALEISCPDIFYGSYALPGTCNRYWLGTAFNADEVWAIFDDCGTGHLDAWSTEDSVLRCSSSYRSF